MSEYKFIETYPDTVWELLKEVLVPARIYGRYFLSEAAVTAAYISKSLIRCVLCRNNKQ